VTAFLARAKFSVPSDAVFAAIDVRVIRIPVQAPRANAIAERFLEVVLREYVAHYISRRPHRALHYHPPAGPGPRRCSVLV
jgi:putative transposase